MTSDETSELRRRLLEAEETLRAIREGAVDAFVVDGPGGGKVYTLEGADRPYRLLVEQMQQGAAILNEEGAIVYCNLSLARFLHVPHERLIGQPLRSYVASASVDYYERLLRECSDNCSRGEIEMLQPGDTVVPTYISCAAQTEVDGVRAGVLITDLTSQKHQEELTAAYEALKRSEEDLRRANADLEQFAFSASHDLQEPIRTLSVYGELLGIRYSDGLDAKGKQYLGFITVAAKRMEALVRDLLAYTQSAGLDQQPVTEVNTVAVLETVLSSLSEAIGEANAEILYGPLPNLLMREVQMQQLFQNLIGNAIKYRLKTESPRIRVNAEPDDGFWKFSVTDNGIGIPPEYAEKVFGLFKRLHNNSSYTGTGIGLAICQRIVERYGGRIWVSSNGPQTGSTFFFTVPALKGSAGAPI